MQASTHQPYRQASRLCMAVVMAGIAALQLHAPNALAEAGERDPSLATRGAPLRQGVQPQQQRQPQQQQRQSPPIGTVLGRLPSGPPPQVARTAPPPVARHLPQPSYSPPPPRPRYEVERRHDGGRRHDGDRRYNRGIAIGVGAAIIGATLGYRYYRGPNRDNVYDRCDRNFPEFDYDTGTFTNEDGDRELCPYLRAYVD
jgi:hypothetical protein